MDRYLITHSLLNSWLYLLKENPHETADSEDNKMQEFLMVLNREPTPTTEAMQNGNEFEALVSETMHGRPDWAHKWQEPAAKIAAIVSGGLWQYSAKREIEVDGMHFLLYGRLDSLKAGHINDVKFSIRYEVGKYVNFTQHPVYMALIPEAIDFTYLVSNGSYVWKEKYRRDETPPIEPIISDFIAWLEANNLMGIYKKNWLAKRRDSHA